jgi:hypothetical protein
MAQDAILSPPAGRGTHPPRWLDGPRRRLVALVLSLWVLGMAGGLTGCGMADAPDDPEALAEEGVLDDAAETGRRDAGSALERGSDAEAGEDSGADMGAKSEADAADAADSGDFRLEYLEADDPELAELARAIQDADVIEPEIAWLNRSFALPRDVPVRWLECGEDNAFYDAETGSIELCYEMVTASTLQFESDGDEAEDAFWFALDTAVFFFHHEVGHALIDLYDLPITGREEDAVDELAALTLIEGWEDGAYAVLSAADSFFISGMEVEAESDPEDLPFWDEHAFDLQRFYSIACLVYGSDPAEMSALIDDGSVPEERAEMCVDEFAQKRESWRRILAPHDLSP